MSTNLLSQNLVPNPDFEYFTSCPIYQNQVNKATPWFNPTGSSPDYFHSCAPTGPWDPVNAPFNLWGYQFAFSGRGYLGGAAIGYTSGDGREYIETQLKDTLLSGSKYYVEFYISRGDSTKYATDRIGLYLSKDSIFDYSTFVYLPYTPQVENDSGNVIYNTQNWMCISGEYVANGGEHFIVIGNFRSFNGSIVDTVDKTTKWNWAYYYIDNVSVYCADSGYTTATAGKDTVICKGDSAQLGTPPMSGYAYSWSPTYGMDPVAGLDSAGATQAQPWVKPQKTTTYILTVVDTVRECKGPGHDSVTVTVVDTGVCIIGIEEFKIQDLRFKIYPNPNDGTMQLDYVLGKAQSGELRILDITGRKIIAYTLSPYANTLSINNSSFKNGLYFYEVNINGEMIVRDKLIIIK
ncbi:MAG: T9SS type A sorting domain-containing protein [Bacteroidetes bacterium]|nr:T9SS type A sorting domain-containing protein [Bacteroidota bacterium]